MRVFIPILACLGIVGCASTENGVRFSGQSSEYQEPKNGSVAYLHLETEKKTDGFGFEPYPHTAIIYELCSPKTGQVKFGYLGDLKVSKNSDLGNPATVKVNSGKPIFLAFGLINPLNGYECTSKQIFTPEDGKSYSFINSVNWSECPTKTAVISIENDISPIKNIKILDKAKIAELRENGISVSREACKT
ncbi:MULTISPECIES: hypothetical protein [unclassified Colwellia]|uniref:hypothetical protein n=1 Tax=unclassified Colwellia TaxID=196834 RepID=UPI0015F6C54D|nr:MULTISPECIES: hypothetical protein [unclassified Colwellia]MBA6358089.1 hypothetical protein [Colwellia sp. BRX8-3]MBA6362023.1 hypothetical protein [Colwellia sp. BRX8-6]MBA6369458.1 hypothetical protein [Colwellia sp. BRX8-5]MBA6377248.1 hypothetical protein [Colwellia sp. BRX8-2]MBA6379276.1 hypothetical protein [Colwellia sp. BRX10-7]|tara:strand:+ start:68 stop:640 length:573 start_codon:yes stop_codon:yes gene_type:complete